MPSYSKFQGFNWKPKFFPSTKSRNSQTFLGPSSEKSCTITDKWSHKFVLSNKIILLPEDCSRTSRATFRGNEIFWRNVWIFIYVFQKSLSDNIQRSNLEALLWNNSPTEYCPKNWNFAYSMAIVCLKELFTMRHGASMDQSIFSSSQVSTRFDKRIIRCELIDKIIA